MKLLYILNGREPVLCPDPVKWGRWFESAENSIVATDIIGALRVSTVFLGMDHRMYGKGPPILFETMIIGEESPRYQQRCCTWADAEIMHTLALSVALTHVEKANAMLRAAGFAWNDEPSD